MLLPLRRGVTGRAGAGTSTGGRIGGGGNGAADHIFVASKSRTSDGEASVMASPGWKILASHVCAIVQ